MVQGAVKFDQRTIRPDSMNPYISEFSQSPIPSVVEEYTSSPYWQEGTGRKKRFLLKREETA